MMLNEPDPNDAVIEFDADDALSHQGMEKFLDLIPGCLTCMELGAELVEGSIENVKSMHEDDGAKGKVGKVSAATILHLLSTICMNSVADMNKKSGTRFQVDVLERRIGHVTLQMLKGYGLATYRSNRQRN